MKKISGRNQRTKARRHRNMEEARAQLHLISEQIANTTSEEEKQKLWEKYFSYSTRSTRSSNQL